MAKSPSSLGPISVTPALRYATSRSTFSNNSDNKDVCTDGIVALDTVSAFLPARHYLSAAYVSMSVCHRSDRVLSKWMGCGTEAMYIVTFVAYHIKRPPMFTTIKFAVTQCVARLSVTAGSWSVNA